MTIEKAVEATVVSGSWPPSSLEDADQRVARWASELLPDVTVDLGPPGGDATQRTVNVHLAELVSSPALRGPERAPLQVDLRYLITATAPDHQTAHRLLGQLLFSAMDRPGFGVEVEAPAPEFWRSLGVSPRPCFHLRIPCRVVRPQPSVPIVRQRLSIKTEPFGRLEGRVLGPGDIPLASARVEIPMVNLVTQTGPDGRFAFAGVPLDPSQKTVVIRARGREQTVSVAQPTDDQTVLIRFSPPDVSDFA
jgi:hypothetical protein